MNYRNIYPRNMLQIETCILIILRMVPVEKQTKMTKDCTFRLNKKAQERGILFQSSTAARVTKVDHETVEAKKLKCPFSFFRKSRSMQRNRWAL